MAPPDAVATDRRHAIVLAAGAGRRFGGSKMLADWGGEPLVLAAVRTALAAPVETVTVVVGGDGEAVARALAALPQQRLRVRTAADWREGLSASLRAGMASLPGDAASAVLFLGDMPRIPQHLAAQLLAALDAGARAAVVVSPRGPAHPVAFARDCFGDLRKLSGDRGARDLLHSLGSAVARIESDDPGVTFDVNLPGHLRTAAQRAPK